MDRKLEEEDGPGFVDQVEERYRRLSAEADTALERLGDMWQVSRSGLASEVDHVEAARELMSSQVVALRRVSEDQFKILRHDIERVTGEFEEAVRHLRELAENPAQAGRLGTSAREGDEPATGSREQPRREPRDLAP